MSEGIVYVAFGDSYLDEAENSAESVKQYSDIPIAVITNCQPSAAFFDEIITVDSVSGSFATKVEYMAKSPFDKTIYLDTDTIVCGDISDLFSILEAFDIAAKHKSGFYPTGPIEYPHVPESFPEYNTGVIAFRSNSDVDDFFESWVQEYERYVEKGGNDQPAFRKALFDSDLRVSTLKEQYHCRFVYPGCVTRQAKVFHGRPEQANENTFDEVINKLNKTDMPRVFLPTDSGLRVLERTTPFNVRHSDQYMLTLVEHAKAATTSFVFNVGRRARSLKRKYFG